MLAIRAVEHYGDDIRFVIQLRGKADARKCFTRQRRYVKEPLEILFCADAKCAATEVRSEMRCIKDCDNTSIFGRTPKAGEVQRTRSYLINILNSKGMIAEVKGPSPEILRPWRIEAA